MVLRRSSIFSVLSFTGFCVYLLIEAGQGTAGAQQYLTPYAMEATTSTSHTILFGSTIWSESLRQVRYGTLPHDVDQALGGPSISSSLASVDLGPGTLEFFVGADFGKEGYIGEYQPLCFSSVRYRQELLGSSLIGYLGLSIQYDLETNQGWYGSYDLGIIYFSSKSTQIDLSFQGDQIGEPTLTTLLRFRVFF